MKRVLHTAHPVTQHVSAESSLHLSRPSSVLAGLQRRVCGVHVGLRLSRCSAVGRMASEEEELLRSVAAIPSQSERDGDTRFMSAHSRFSNTHVVTNRHDARQVHRGSAVGRVGRQASMFLSLSGHQWTLFDYFACGHHSQCVFEPLSLRTANSKHLERERRRNAAANHTHFAPVGRPRARRTVRARSKLTTERTYALLH